MQTVYTFQVANEWDEPLFTMDVEIDGEADDAQRVAEGKAKRACRQCYPHDDEQSLRVWLKNVHVEIDG